MILAAYEEDFKPVLEIPYRDAIPVFMIIKDEKSLYEFLKMQRKGIIFTFYSIEDEEIEKLDSFFYKPTYRTSLMEIMERYDESLPSRIKGDFLYSDFFDYPERVFGFVEQDLEEKLPLNKRQCNRLCKSPYFAFNMKVIISGNAPLIPTIKFLNPNAMKSLVPVMSVSGNKILPGIIDLRHHTCFAEYALKETKFNAGFFMTTDAFFNESKASASNLLLTYWQNKKSDGRPEGTNLIKMETFGDGKYLLHHEDFFETKRGIGFNAIKEAVKKSFPQDSVLIDEDEMTITTQKDELKKIVREVLPENFGEAFNINFMMHFKEAGDIRDFLLSAAQGAEYCEARKFFEELDLSHIREEGLLINDEFKDKENNDRYVQISLCYSEVTGEYGLLVYCEKAEDKYYNEKIRYENEEDLKKYYSTLIKNPLIQETILDSVASPALGI